MERLWLVVCLCVCALAHADVIDSPDVQAAKRHFALGTNLYNEGRYSDAMVEFRRAKQTHNAPAFDFNIARCLERLERWGEAADAYEAYLKTLPNAPERAEVTERIVVLRKRVAPAVSATSTPGLVSAPSDAPSSRRRTKPWVWGVVGGAVGLVVVGAIVAGVVVGTAKDPSQPIAGVQF